MPNALHTIAALFTTSMIAACAYCLYLMVWLMAIAPDHAVDTIRLAVAVQMVCGIIAFAMLTRRALR